MPLFSGQKSAALIIYFWLNKVKIIEFFSKRCLFFFSSISKLMVIEDFWKSAALIIYFWLNKVKVIEFFSKRRLFFFSSISKLTVIEDFGSIWQSCLSFKCFFRSSMPKWKIEVNLSGPVLLAGSMYSKILNLNCVQSDGNHIMHRDDFF